MSKLKEIFELRLYDARCMRFSPTNRVVSIEGVAALRKAAKKYNFDVNSVLGNFDSWIPVLNSNSRTVGQVIATRTARGIWIN
tara:strand:- start:283 stop:531 length:249 start_codon:yes stop_codon:yes gene_type:complete